MSNDNDKSLILIIKKNIENGLCPELTIDDKLDNYFNK